MNINSSNKIQISFTVGLVMVVSGALAGWAVLLKVLHAWYPGPAPLALLAQNPSWTVASPVVTILLLTGVYYGVGQAYVKWGKVADYGRFSQKLAIPFLFFAFWIIKPFVNYQRGIFTSTAILALITLFLLTRKEIFDKT